MEDLTTDETQTDRVVPFRRPLTEEDLIRMQIPARFWSVDLDQVPAGGTLRAPLLKYLGHVHEMHDQCVGILMHGNNGRGKTSAGCLILMEARRQGYTGLLLEAAKVKGIVINRTEFDDDETLWERAQSVDFLVFDDLWKGTADGKGFGEDLIDELIRTRSANMKPTIITTNMGLAQAVAGGFVKQSTVQALRESVVVLEVIGPNMRVETESAINEFFFGG